MNLEGVDIGDLHDPLRDLIQPLPSERAGVQTLDVRAVKDEITIERLAFTHNLNGTCRRSHGNQNGRSIVFDQIHVDDEYGHRRLITVVARR